VDLYIGERLVVMAALAIPAELPVMYIIAAVTVSTGSRQPDPVCRISVMAGEAIQVCVRPLQREFCQGVVIVIPQPPAIGVMTVFTIRPQLVFVDIIRLVAVVAVAGCSPESGTDMAFLTGNRCMQAHEREVRHVMIEPYPFSPAILAMTISTLFSQLPRMNIVNCMAAIAVRIRFLALKITSVTGRAACLFMLAQQGKFCFCVVIETRLPPVIR